jgi:hypothetical protein
MLIKSGVLDGIKDRYKDVKKSIPTLIEDIVDGYDIKFIKTSVYGTNWFVLARMTKTSGSPIGDEIFSKYVPAFNGTIATIFIIKTSKSGAAFSYAITNEVFEQIGEVCSRIVIDPASPLREPESHVALWRARCVVTFTITNMDGGNVVFVDDSGAKRAATVTKHPRKSKARFLVMSDTGEAYSLTKELVERCSLPT